MAKLSKANTDYASTLSKTINGILSTSVALTKRRLFSGSLDNFFSFSNFSVAVPICS